ncbi:MAG: YncE family protein [bacterium]
MIKRLFIIILVACLLASGFFLYFSKNKERLEELSSANFAITNPSARSTRSGQATSTSSRLRQDFGGQAGQATSTDSTSTSAGSVQATTSAPLVNNIKSNLADLPGQLVHHLFNINSVPAPKGASFSPNGQEIWATLLLNKSRGVAVFDAGTGKNIANINLANGGGVEMIFAKDGSKAYVSQMETAQVFEIDTATKKVLQVFDTKGNWTKELDFSSDGQSLFASNWVGNTVTEIDIETGKTIRQIPTVKTPRGMYATKDGNFLYVAGFDKGEIQKVDLKTGQGKVIYKSNGAMRHIVGDENRGVLYVSDMGKMSIMQVDLATDQVKKFATTDTNPNTIALSPDKKVLFVSCRGVNATAENYYIPGPEWGSVLLFDTQTGNMLDAIVGGNQPTALAVSPNGQQMVFSDFLDNRLQVFKVPEYSVLLAGYGGRSSVYKSQLKK